MLVVMAFAVAGAVLFCHDGPCGRRDAVLGALLGAAAGVFLSLFFGVLLWDMLPKEDIVTEMHVLSSLRDEEMQTDFGTSFSYIYTYEETGETVSKTEKPGDIVFTYQNVWPVALTHEKRLRTGVGLFVFDLSIVCPLYEERYVQFYVPKDILSWKGSFSIDGK
jgi:hypothetical protein